MTNRSRTGILACYSRGVSRYSLGVVLRTVAEGIEGTTLQRWKLGEQEHDYIRDGDVRTSFATTSRIPQLLQAAPDLLRGPPLPGRLEDIIRDKPIPHREPTKESRLPRIIWLIRFQTCSPTININGINGTRRADAMGKDRPSSNAASSSGGQTTSPPLNVFQLFLPLTIDWNTSCVLVFWSAGVRARVLVAGDDRRGAEAMCHEGKKKQVRKAELCESRFIDKEGLF